MYPMKSWILILTALLFAATPLMLTAQHQPDAHQPAVTHAPDSAAHGAGTAEHADGHGESGKFNPSAVIMHHILETHDWHIVDIPAGTDAEGHKQYTPVGLHLPWLFFSSTEGLQFYADTHALLATGDYTVEHEILHAVDPSEDVYDFSPSKTVVQMFLILTLLTIILIRVAGKYKKRRGMAPTGAQNFFEVIITFVRDDVVRPNLGDKADAFAPYMLTLFFFIWFSNVFGLLPFNSNIMGNISITAALAVLTFILITVNGTKDYFVHIVWMPGTPIAIRPLLAVIEIASMFIKPIALMIRLFANISAGHFMVLSLVSLMFIMGKEGTSLSGALSISPVTILLTLFVFTLETLVTIVQAYIFTLLTCIFIGSAMERHEHHEEGHHH